MNGQYRKPSVKTLRGIFGEGSVFHPCREKRPIWKKWQLRTVHEMDEKAIREIDPAPQTGVLCGSNSNGLVCLDFDNRAALAQFLSVLQPELRTTCVVGKPGRAKFFFRIPQNETRNKQKLRINGADVGDWLDNLSQAIVAGIHHETGEPYKIEDASPPFECARKQLELWLAEAGVTVFDSIRDNFSKIYESLSHCNPQDGQSLGQSPEGAGNLPLLGSIRKSPIPPNQGGMEGFPYTPRWGKMQNRYRVMQNAVMKKKERIPPLIPQFWKIAHRYLTTSSEMWTWTNKRGRESTSCHPTSASFTFSTFIKNGQHDPENGINSSRRSCLF